MSKQTRSRCRTFAHTNRSLIGRFLVDRRGNVAMLMAFLAVPILGVVGLAVDHSMAGTSQMALNNAADAAALGALKRTEAVYTSKEGSTAQAAIDAGVVAGVDQFLSNASKLPFTTVQRPKITVTIVGRVITATVTWAGKTKSNFGSLFGVDTIALNGNSEASQRLPAYTKIIVVLDNSGSMGIGTDHNEQINVHNAIGCAVGCHIPIPSLLKNNETPYTIARAKNAFMRIDLMRDALIDLVRDVEAVEKSPEFFKFGVYTFSSDLSTVVDINDQRSSDKKYVTERLEKIELTPKGGGTNFARALINYSRANGTSNAGVNISDIIQKTARGDGSSADRPIVYVLLMTDGVEDFVTYDDPPTKSSIDPNFKQVQPNAPLWDPNGGQNFYGLQALDDTLCQQVKDVGGANLKLLTLQAKYIVPEGYLNDGDARFDWIDTTLLKSGVVDSRMKACASEPALSFKGTAPEEIAAGMREMFEIAAPALSRLTR